MRFRLLAVAFFSGMSVMALEITASRVIAPYFGASIFVWTNVIGIILIALSIGYLLGSRLAKSGAGHQALGKIITLAALFSLLAPISAKPLSRLLIVDVLGGSSGLVTVFVGSFTAIVILFAIPILLLGAVGPIVISILSKGGADAGEVAGRVFAVSTAGSLIGTFLPTLVTIPLLGTRATIALFAGIMLLTVVALLSKKKAAAIVPLIFAPVLLPTVHANAVYERETPYQYVQVLRTGPFEESLRTNEGIAVQSIYRSDAVLTGSYWDHMASLAGLPGQPRTLILGLAGGTISRELVAFYRDRGIRIDGVEIDPAIVRIARDRFELDQPGLTVHTEDGRVFLQKSREQYDLIVVDVYANQVYIPFHMASVEFFRMVSERLAPGGIMAMNVNAPNENSLLLQRISSTAAAAFPYAYRVRTDPLGWNYIVMGSNEPVDWGRLAERAPPELAWAAAEIRDGVYPIHAEKEPLTDDRAPVELLTDRTVFEAMAR